MSVRPRVLVCDADPQSLRALRVVLRGAGFDVDETSTANAALDHSAMRAPDGAIIELVLPDGDGVQVCRRLREWSAMPVIVLSAIDDEEHKVRALEAGADDYLTKPLRSARADRTPARVPAASPQRRRPAAAAARPGPPSRTTPHS